MLWDLRYICFQDRTKFCCYKNQFFTSHIVFSYIMRRKNWKKTRRTSHREVGTTDKTWRTLLHSMLETFKDNICTAKDFFMLLLISFSFCKIKTFRGIFCLLKFWQICGVLLFAWSHLGLLIIKNVWYLNIGIFIYTIAIINLFVCWKSMWK